MSTKKPAIPEPEHIETANLPSLPEPVHAWLGRADAAEHTTQLSRKTASRWQRAGSFAFGPDRFDRILAAVSAHVTEYGTTTWRLSTGSDELDAVHWTSTVRDRSTRFEFPLADPRMLLQTSWDLTFRLGDDYRELMAVTPRLIGEVTSMIREAANLLREASSSSETATIEVMKAEASQKKMDRVIDLLERFGSHPESKKDTKAIAAKKDHRQVIDRLYESLTDEDREALAAHPLGSMLETVESWSDLQAVVRDLWAAHASKEDGLSFSIESLQRVRKLWREFQ